MLDRGTSPEKDPLASLSRKKIHGHDSFKHINIQKKYMCSCNHLSTNLYVQSLQSYICGLYVYIYYTYIWSLPCYIKGFNLSMSIQKAMAFGCWLFTRMKKGLYQERSASKLPPKEFSQNNSIKHFFKQVFHEQIVKRNLHKINL